MEGFAKGHTGQIEYDGNEVLIRHSGMLASMSGLQDVTVPVASIARLEFKSASIWTNGFLEVIPLGSAARRTLVANTKNSLAVVFTRKQQPQFEQALGCLKDAVAKAKESGAPAGKVTFPAPPTARAAIAPPAAGAVPVYVPPAHDGASVQARHTLVALVLAAAAVIAWKIWVDPQLRALFPQGTPWWVLVLAFLSIFGGIVQQLARDRARERVAYGDVSVSAVSMPVVQTVAAPAVRPAAVAPAAGPAKFCRECGAPASGGAFCSGCGTKLA